MAGCMLSSAKEIHLYQSFLFGIKSLQASGVIYEWLVCKPAINGTWAFLKMCLQWTRDQAAVSGQSHTEELPTCALGILGWLEPRASLPTGIDYKDKFVPLDSFCSAQDIVTHVESLEDGGPLSSGCGPESPALLCPYTAATLKAWVVFSVFAAHLCLRCGKSSSTTS
jgi:hypothetical protein